MAPTHKRILLFAITLTNIIGRAPHSIAQNILPNANFETYFACPTDFNNPGNPDIQCTPWRSGTWGTPDYFNTCVTPPNNVAVPQNWFGWQEPLSGEAYCGFWLRALVITDYREYIQVDLGTPLTAGKWYYVSYNVSLANRFCGINHIGAYFSAEPPPYDYAMPLIVNPQVESSTFLSDTANWMLVEGCFKATGTEQIMTIGNFHTNADTPTDPTCYTNVNSSYYYIDDVFLSEVQPGALDIELDGPVSACYEYTIDPGITGVDYYWEGGSTEETLTVYTSGTYGVTIYNGCDAGIDSIEVVITNAPDVSLEPEDIIICQGETVEFSLNPDYGEYTWSDGSHASEYVISTTGDFYVTLDDGCDITSDHIGVIVLDPPAPFSLGGDTLLCTGSQIEFEFDPYLGDFLWLDHNTSNYYIITQEGYYAVTITNMCGEASADLEVGEIDPVVVSLGPAYDTICTGEVLNYSFDPNIGTYVWQDGSTATDYQIDTSGIYSITMTHYCGVTTDSIRVLAMEIPSFDLGDTLSACHGDTIIFSITDEVGEYTWQDGSDSTHYEVTTSGTYFLTIENICGTNSGDAVVMYQTVLSAVDFGPDFSLCPSETAVLNANNPNATIVWQDLSTADTFLVNAAGSYFVMVSNGCETYTDTVNVLLENQPPMIIMPDQLILCQGTIEELDPGVSGVNYDWNNGTHNSTLIISAPGQYSLTVTNTCGSDVDTVTVFDGGPLPMVSLGLDTSICTGSMINLNPFSSNVNTWLWPDGSMSSGYATSSAGTVFVEVSNGCGVAYDTMMVSLLSLTPALSLGPDVELCPGTTSNLTITEPNVDITWSDGSTGNNFIVTDADAQVYATITNGCGESSDTIDVSLLPASPMLELGVDQSLCPGEVIIFDPGITGVIYLWQDGSTASSFQTTQQATVILTISNVCGSSTDTVVVTESTEGPQVDLGPDVHACEGEMITVISGISGVSYLWQDGSTNNDYVATTSGWVYLTVTNLCGVDTDSILVDISGVVPVPDLGIDTTLCEGNTLMLVSNADPFTSIEWQDGSASPNFLVTSAGTYSVTEVNQCGSATDEISVSYILLPLPFSLGPDTSICAGESFVLIAPSTLDNIQWQDGSAGSTMIADKAQTYSLQISNTCGVTSDNVVVEINSDLPQLNLASPVPLCPGTQITLVAEQTFAANYIWSTGENNASIVVTVPGLYSVEVFAPCSSVSGQVEVISNNDCSDDDDIYIPNIFSPNDDQVNDVFTLSFGPDLQLTGIEGSIYDRWGNLVFSSEVIPFVWDGRFKDETVMPGVYVYNLKLKYMIGGEEREEVLTGDVSLIK